MTSGSGPKDSLLAHILFIFSVSSPKNRLIRGDQSHRPLVEGPIKAGEEPRVDWPQELLTKALEPATLGDKPLSRAKLSLNQPLAKRKKEK